MSAQTYVDEVRDRFIFERLKNVGKIGRKEIREKFLVSGVTAAAIFTRFKARHPNAIVYDTSLRAYVPNPDQANPEADSSERFD